MMSSGTLKNLALFVLCVAGSILSGCIAPPVTVPNVVDMTQAAAQAALTSAGLTLGTVTEEYSASIPDGNVVSQTPAAGASAARGTAVALALSQGEDPAGVTVSVPAGTFVMGNSGVGDDAVSPGADESPLHAVTLGAYQIGKYDVTNQEYCEVLNWALAQGYLKDAAGAPWAGAGDLYAGGVLQEILVFTDPECNIGFAGGVFSPKKRVGLPGTTIYPTDTHPVVDVSWYGAAAFCSWLNQMEGLTICYDMTTANWPLTVAPPSPGGYRLPTEAEWERAAAWDGSKHWIYGFTADTLGTAADRCNDVFVNPLGLTGIPFTSPVGWFDGVNVSPNGGVTTVNSVSPTGCYDMSGNVWQWVQDWYSASYYGGGPMTNPVGPAPVLYRVYRGGSWDTGSKICRSAFRDYSTPTDTSSDLGFRLAKSN